MRIFESVCAFYFLKLLSNKIIVIRFKNNTSDNFYCVKIWIIWQLPFPPIMFLLFIHSLFHYLNVYLFIYFFNFMAPFDTVYE